MDRLEAGRKFGNVRRKKFTRRKKKDGVDQELEEEKGKIKDGWKKTKNRGRIMHVRRSRRFGRGSGKREE